MRHFTYIVTTNFAKSFIIHNEFSNYLDVNFCISVGFFTFETLSDPKIWLQANINLYWVLWDFMY